MIPNSEPKYKGKWRHINIKNSNKKSILDFVIVNNTLQKKINRTVISEKECYKLKERNSAYHKAIIIEIQKHKNQN